MKLKTIFIISLFYSLILACASNTKDMVVSFILRQERPTVLLTPNLCWNKYESLSLAKKLNENGINIASAMQPSASEYYLHHVMIMVDFTCPETTTLLLWASDNSYFRSPYRWLLITSNGENLDVLNDVEALVDSNVVIAKRISDREFVFTEVYRVSKNSDLIFTERGTWQAPPKSIKNCTKNINNSTTQTHITTDISIMNERRKRDLKGPEMYGVVDGRSDVALASRRRDLRGHTLTMVNVITDSNLTRYHLNDRLHLHQDSITKMSYMVVKICFEMLNATEKLIFTHTWGYKDKNGNWQGIVDHLLKKEADLGTLTIFTQERMKYIDYIAMVGSTAVRFVFREPPLALLSNIFTLPFTGAVWWAIVICVLACALFLFITSKWEATMGMHPLQLDGSWADVLILIIGAVLQQGCTLEPRYAAGRCVTLLLFVALTILYAAYSANIVVLLRAPSSSVRTLPDLLNSPLKLGASDFEYNRYFFKKLNEPIRKAIYDKKIAPKGKKPNFYSMKDGVERIRKGLFAFHMELNPGYRLIQETYQEEEKCDLVEIDYINEIDPWVPGQKRSPFKDLFKINFMKIRETGIQSNIHHRLHVPRPRCSGTISTFSSVGITDMYPAIIATLYGMLLSPAVLLLEITYRRLIQLRNNKRLMRENHLLGY
ncbi:ionotropic receptor 75a-like [Epargyreus clarus]|uniref:ionotropic receptor 75a-like n=1 Tax=Epargyreus clarus TaxID=520877 RepID=UPI003C2D1F02